MAQELGDEVNLEYFQADEEDGELVDGEFIIRQKSAMEKYNELIPETESRYIKPPKTPELEDYLLQYERAEKLADEVDIHPGCRYYAYVSGAFHFGDLIEALMVKNNWHTKRMIVATLGMSENNVDSLANLMEGGYVDELDLIISDWFFSHERHNLIPYIYEKLDIDNRFQLSVAGSHCKLCVFETDEGLHIGIRGSANLRSSACLEHITIEENPQLNEVDFRVQSHIIETFKTIKKAVRHKTLWNAITN